MSYKYAGCSGLTSVTIGNSVTSIGSSAFSECGLTSVTIPNSVTIIDSRAFYNCRGLTSITIPESVTSIGYNAFGYCSGLTSVHITDLTAWCNISFGGNGPSNPLYYAHHLYLNGEEIKDLVIPEGVTRIGYNAFGYCSGLTSVTIPESVTSIGNAAFSDCSRLKEIKCLAEEPPVVNENTFNRVNVSNVTLYVPKDSYQQYKEHTIWGMFDIAIMTGIELTQGSAEGEKDVYDTNGRRLQSAQRGINIIRYSDGSTRKVMVK